MCTGQRCGVSWNAQVACKRAQDKHLGHALLAVVLMCCTIQPANPCNPDSSIPFSVLRQFYDQINTLRASGFMLGVFALLRCSYNFRPELFFFIRLLLLLSGKLSHAFFFFLQRAIQWTPRDDAFFFVDRSCRKKKSTRTLIRKSRIE